ncbi:MAG: NAD(P)-binding protein [Rhizobiaceae bacterium]|nr:NAD(P)-binding protein [Rhizobiaceae bacterium]
MDVLVVGAGISGATVARNLADAGHSTKVVEARAHVGGHCHTERDPETGIMKHVHGPHIFHSDDEEVWRFVSRFSQFETFDFKVNAQRGERLYPLPINLDTLRLFFGKDFTAAEAEDHVRTCTVQLAYPPRNFEEQALSTVGPKLYEAFFKGYTQKQWGRDPKEIPASVFRRLPLRFSQDRTYFHHSRVGMPRDGYTQMISRILDHPSISVEFNSTFKRSSDQREFSHIFYTGELDAFFEYEFGLLPYRSLRFEDFRVDGDFQASPTVNFPDVGIPYTRITEHKKFAPWENHDRSLCSREYSFECGPGDTPYYPVNLAGGSALLDSYRQAANNVAGVSFIGRLATFRYLDMDVAISEAMGASSTFLETVQSGGTMPAFPHAQA